MARIVKIIKQAKVALGPVPVPPAEIDPATLTDFGCQVTQATISATPNTSDVPATFCEPASQVNVPSSFALTLEGLQDWGTADGLSEYLFTHDAEQAAFALYLDAGPDPVATGIVSVAAGDFGGTAGEPLTMSLELPILGYPDITGSDGASLRPDPVAAEASAPQSSPAPEAEPVGA